MARPPRRTPLSYLEAVGVALSIFLNALMGGRAWQPLSARFADCRSTCAFCRTACVVLGYLLGHGHCEAVRRKFLRLHSDDLDFWKEI
ncbi:MAG TPA: hypothetical protein VFA22_07130 [Stellaceae bacterium]|nr:hypothetical protein [Stellaceae bacterium]